MSAANPVPPQPGMRDVHVPPGGFAYLRSLAARRAYILEPLITLTWAAAATEIQARQMTSVLGNLWHLLNPLLQIGVYYLIFGVVLGVDRGDDYFAFLSIGLFMFLFTQRATIAGANSIANNKGLLNAFSFPRALLPVTSTLTEMFANIGPFLVMFLIAVLSGVTPDVRWLFFAPLVVVQMVFNIGASLVAARAGSTVRDFSNLLPFVFRILLYGSGVLFDVERYVDDASYGWIFDLNPVYCVVTLARWSILGGDFQAGLAVVLAGWTVAIGVAGLAWFRAGEGNYGRE
ncbi:MAG: ABC transporter permease [Ilumatobacteraceae bacterium]